MEHEKNLPWELIEEILSHVPPKSLVRFRTVCKRWNALFNDKTFINNHKETFRFILATESKIYSVSIDPKIEVRELTLDIPGLESQASKKVIGCNEFLLCGMDTVAVVWNPWLKQTRWIEFEGSKTGLDFQGIGHIYDNASLERSGYKTLFVHWKELDLDSDDDEDETDCWNVHDLDSSEWEDMGSDSDEEENPTLHSYTDCVSLNGILSWVAFYDWTDPLYHLLKFDFLSKKFKKFCDLPCRVNHDYDTLVHKVFREDRFSLLKQCHETKKIEIWVTKNKINFEDGDNVVWKNFMTFSIPNFPSLVPQVQLHNYQPSYFINDTRLVLCFCDKTGRAWIYILGENKLIRKVQLDSDPWPLHCAYIPSLIPVPQGKKEVEADITKT